MYQGAIKLACFISISMEFLAVLLFGFPYTLVQSGFHHAHAILVASDGLEAGLLDSGKKPPLYGWPTWLYNCLTTGAGSVLHLCLEEDTMSTWILTSDSVTFGTCTYYVHMLCTCLLQICWSRVVSHLLEDSMNLQVENVRLWRGGDGRKSFCSYNDWQFISHLGH